MYHPFAHQVRAFVIGGALLLTISGQRMAVEPADFENPSATAKATGYWWWFNGRMDPAGITRDLEACKAKGRGGVMLVGSASGNYGGRPVPAGTGTFLSPEWRELYRFALDEAHRPGLEVGVNFCGGWCMGSPWRMEFTRALKSGTDHLEIEGGNLWPNRLMGDAGWPAKQQRTQTNIRTFTPDSSLKPSGLMGAIHLLVKD